ncbi:MAG TPA: D-2-hydroxyacid dehydrogenase [Candidatus Scatomonas pullistercoris]|uniref:D-2-hydroxyacid dehydrogenase n=1 Tax=Candidatus Scatomonas pullistercoris TaxID=2840920 RepID=A0A9D1P3M7_9FIRM|nr:D-2-hydroxyacid dehydrogenase [Candidatus Scatomonas pullistercoris]
MKIVMLEAASLGDDLDFSGFEKYGELAVYEKTTREQCPDRIREADIIMANKLLLDEGTLSGAQRLKLICITATGVNNVDLEYAKSRGIGVANVAGYSTASVAQHTFAMYFYVAEKLRYFDEYVKSGGYAASDSFSNLQEKFSELAGKTWGIVGLGAIGKRTAEIAEAFGCRVVYYSSSGKDRNPRYRRLELAELLELSDVVSVHAPLTAATEKLFTYERFCQMKPDAIFINVGRGPIVDEAGLLRALEEEKIAGAALDVLCTEPMAADNPLLAFQDSRRLLITPHIAWASREARQLLVQKLEENLKSFLDGGRLNRVC